MGAAGTFIARGIDREQKHLQELMKAAHAHKGTSFVEIYQNCVIFNDGVFSSLTDKMEKQNNVLVLEQGKPMVFGKDRNKGLCLVGSKLKVVTIGDKYNLSDVLVHDETNKIKGLLLSELTYEDGFPTPIGILYREDKSSYEEMMMEQIDNAKLQKGKGKLDKLFHEGHTWEVK